MKRLLSFLLSGGLCAALIWLLHHPQGDLPALGPLADPVKGFMGNAESTREPGARIIISEGVSEPVEVIFDDRLVPHIFASNEEDLYFAQGYVSASLRLWQMEMTAFAASGRVSEKLGPDFIEYDRLQRRLGMLSSAEDAMNALDWESPTGKAVEAYSKGVNLYISQINRKNLPLEYKLMDFEPEEWSTLKTFLLLKYMAKTLTGWDDDAAMSNVRNILANEDFERLFSERYPNEDPIIPTGTYESGLPDIDSLVTPALGTLFPANDRHTGSERHTGIGSNNWAINAALSASGNPILCNDPHLPLNLPSLWLEVQLYAPGMNVYGASLPGSPCVIIGFNENVAWGVTNAGWDVRDWYLLETRGNDSYLLDGEWIPLTSRTEIIRVKDGEDITDTVYSSHHGPLVYRNFDSTYTSWGNLAMKWAAHQPSNELRTFYLLNKANNISDYLEATRTFVCPAQNIVFASKEDDIALRVSGEFPQRPVGQGRTILDGSSSSNDWSAPIPWMDNPIVVNPDRMFVSSANQHPTDTLYPYYYSGFDFEHFRNRRINGELRSKQSWSVADMKKLQNDNFNLIASEALPSMLAQLEKDALGKSARSHFDLLANWDHVNAANSKAASLFQLWWDAYTALLWDEFDPDRSVNLIRPGHHVTIASLEWDPDYRFFDHSATPDLEDRMQILEQSFIQASEAFSLLEKEGNETWYAVKGTTVKHLASLEAFSRANVNIGGNRNIVNATSSTNGPSWRMIVELGDTPTASVIYPGGQSGNPGSLHYDDFIDDWANGDYYQPRFYMSAEEAKKNHNHQITIQKQ